MFMLHCICCTCYIVYVAHVALQMLHMFHCICSNAVFSVLDISLYCGIDKLKIDIILVLCRVPNSRRTPALCQRSRFPHRLHSYLNSILIMFFINFLALVYYQWLYSPQLRLYFLAQHYFTDEIYFFPISILESYPFEIEHSCWSEFKSQLFGSKCIN